MTFSVAKEFNTNNRRFKVGAIVSETDITDSVLTWEHLEEKGFVIEAVPEPEPAPKKLKSF